MIAIDVHSPTPSAWKTIVPEGEGSDRRRRGSIGGRIVVQYLRRRAEPAVAVRPRRTAGRATSRCRAPAPSPDVGGREDAPEIFYAFTLAALSRRRCSRYDPRRSAEPPFEAAEPPIDVSRYETEALFATSKDGTRVPFFLTAREGPGAGRQPIRRCCTATAGSRSATLPTYRPDVPAWLEMGGVWVTANMRGGAEYGEAWHKAGMLEKKQNVFDDFIAVAEHLIKEGYTSPATLGDHGRVERRPAGRRGRWSSGRICSPSRCRRSASWTCCATTSSPAARAWATEYGSSAERRAVRVPASSTRRCRT